MRRLNAFGIAGAIALAACSPSAKKSDGPVVAKGEGIAITEQDFKARLDEQSPFIRSRYQTLERKKEFLDNLIRFEVLAREAEKQGLAKDPEVLNTMKKIMVQKLVQKTFSDVEGAKNIPEAELQAYYDSHKSDYYRPRKVRLAAVVWNAPEGTPERAKDVAAAKKAAARVKAEEKKNALVFAQVVNEYSEDPASKAAAGDLNFKTAEELEQAYGKPFADTALALKPGETSGVVETKQGVYVVKATGEQQTRQQSAGVEPGYRNLQHRSHDNQHHAWRNQDAQGAAGTDGAGRQRGVVSGFEHDGRRHQRDDRHRGAHDSGGGSKQGRREDGSEVERPVSVPEKQLHGME
jgi:peptidyl-prolyl cis-trans isomerase C